MSAAVVRKRQKEPTTRCQSHKRSSAWWGATQKEAIICQSTQELTPQDMFDSSGNQMNRRIRTSLGAPKQISLDTTNTSVLAFVHYCLSRFSVARSPAKLKAREDKIKEARKQKTPKSEDQEWNSGRWKRFRKTGPAEGKSSHLQARTHVVFRLRASSSSARCLDFASAAHQNRNQPKGGCRQWQSALDRAGV